MGLQPVPGTPKQQSAPFGGLPRLGSASTAASPPRLRTVLCLKMVARACRLCPSSTNRAVPISLNMAPHDTSPHGSVADVDYDNKHGTKDMISHLEHDSGEVAQFATLSAEERAAALKLAHEADPGPEIASWRFACFIATCFVVIVNSCDTGFDTTIMSSVVSLLI